MDLMKDSQVVVYLKWTTVTPDKRQWKPSMPILEPVKVLVKVHVPGEYASIDENNDVILSPEGMRYVIDQLENVMKDRIDTPDDNDTDDWDDESEGTIETDDWEDDDETTSGLPEELDDEDWE